MMGTQREPLGARCVLRGGKFPVYLIKHLSLCALPFSDALAL